MRHSCISDWLRISGVTVAVAGFVLADAAEASPFTLSAPIPITGSEPGNPGVVGTLQPVGPGALGQGIGLSDGNVSFLANDVLVFSLSLSLSLSASSSAVDGLGVGAASTPLFGNPVGAGSFVDSGGGNQVPSFVAASSVLLLGFFEFIPDTLSTGETTVDLFVTYNPAGSALAVGSTANFMISSGTDFTVQGTLAKIPEPASILMIAGALSVLALRRRA